MRIPIDVTFADLELELDDAGGMHYLPGPLGEFAMLNGIDP